MAFEFNVALVGITVVFLALLFLAFIIFGSSRVLSFRRLKKNDDEITITPRVKDNSEEVSPAAGNPGNTTHDEELVAVLTAAVISYMNAKNRAAGCKIRIKSYRRVPQISPVWNTTARMELTL